MKKVTGILASLVLGFILISCGGGSSSNDDPKDDPKVTPPDSETKTCMAVSYGIGELVHATVENMSSPTYNITSGRYTLKGTRSGSAGNYSYALTLTFNSYPDTLEDENGKSISYTLSGDVTVNCTHNTDTDVFTATMTPTSGSLSIDYDSTAHTVSSYDLIFTDTGSGSDYNIKGTATVDGTAKDLSYSW